MNFNTISATNKLLLIMVIALSFYVLKVLSFIFIPFMFATFAAILFMPFMRWLHKKNINKYISLTFSLLIISLIVVAAIGLVKITSNELLAGREEFYTQLDYKIGETIAPYAESLGIELNSDTKIIKQIIWGEQFQQFAFKNLGVSFNLVQRTLSMILITLFFLILLLAGSVNFNLIMQETIFSHQTQSIKTFIKIEKNIVKFLIVKFLISLATGITFTIICLSFGIKFPIFWGVIAFTLNFIQLVGSVVSTTLASIFVMIELNNPGTILLIILLFTATQIFWGSILEPIFMGKSFSINIVTVLVMLMFWGFLWGIPGLILSIPITVLLKTLLEQFPKTKFISNIMS